MGTVNSLVGQNAQFIKMPDPFRLAEYQAIGAKKIPDSLIDAYGKVTYHEALKAVESQGNIDSIIKSIQNIYRISDGVFTGKSVNSDGDEKVFNFDITKGKIKNLAGFVSASIDGNGKNGRARIRFSNLSSVPASRFLACLNLLVDGYVVDNWNLLQVNHKDNSAGVVYYNSFWKENLAHANLELFVDTKSNTQHGIIWEKLYNELNITSSFSCYNKDFIKFINQLIKNKQFTEENVMSWKNKRTNPNTGVVYFE